MNKKLMSLIFGVMCMILTLGIFIQVKTIDSANISGFTDVGDDKLRNDLLEWRQRYKSANVLLTKTEKELETIRKKVAENDIQAETMEKELEDINMLLGLTDVKGNGVIVTLDDNKQIDEQKVLSIDQYLIHDTNILRVVNELKSAGAEAISVNDLRITNITSITCVGPVIKIDGERVAAPYIIKAIGFPESLMSISIPGGLIQYLKAQGKIVDIKKENDIIIYKYNSAINAKYMQYAD